MKNATKKMLALVAILSANTFFACAQKSVSVTFVQDGQMAITKTVKAGERLTDIPQPKAVEGYTIAWDRTDFENLKTSITVTAVAIPNVYTIYYNVGKGVVLENTETFVAYNQEFTLETPTLKGSTFVGWKLNGEDSYLQSGIYTFTEDVEVTAVWSVDNDNEYTYIY